ncbi:PAB1 binding protein [Microbotryomycetes sp. JL221]|nr:PAB1 binding protein [Microbotryomycetes sp. JL221]
MSDPSSDAARKRSRSSSPGPGTDAHAAPKKPNTDQAGPDNLTRDDEEQNTSTNGNNSIAPMNVDSTGDLPANPGPEAAAAAAATAASAASTSNPGETTAPSTQIQMRALIVTQDASIIIGKGGKNVNEIREKSGSKITITESIPGNPERIMTIGGPLDAVSKAFGLIVRRINDEPFESPSVPGSRAVTIRFIIPNVRMGSVIGKGGSKIKEIQEASGARLQASEAMLPGSTERVLSISGVADAIHIAVYYVGTVLQEHPTPPASNTPYRPGASNPVPYGYPPPPPPLPDYARGMYGGGGGGGGYGGGRGMPAHGAGGGALLGPGSQTQQIYIPNELVGSIIGKGGAKINEVRSTSQCTIKINEPGEGVAAHNANERLVTITGQPANIQLAVRMLYERLEQEKQKQLTSV